MDKGTNKKEYKYLGKINSPDELKKLEKSDIDLLCVLMSPIFGFTAEDMALIRAESRRGDLFSALVFASENYDKAGYINDFMSFVKEVVK